jgi:hypothetical protein
MDAISACNVESLADAGLAARRGSRSAQRDRPPVQEARCFGCTTGAAVIFTLLSASP